MSLLYFVQRVRCRHRKDYEWDRQANYITLNLISWRSNTMVLPRRKERARQTIQSCHKVTEKLCMRSIKQKLLMVSNANLKH